MWRQPDPDEQRKPAPSTEGLSSIPGSIAPVVGIQDDASQVGPWSPRAPEELENLTTPQTEQKTLSISEDQAAPEKALSPEHPPNTRTTDYISAIARSPIGWWGGGNCLAAFGVSWAGFVCNAILTPLSLWRELRSIGDSSNQDPNSPTVECPQQSLRALWLASPALFAVVDAVVIGISAAESFYRATLSSESAGIFLAKGVAFTLYMAGSPGAIHAINRSYWTSKGVTDPLGETATKLARSLPTYVQTVLLSTGLWWGAGDCVMGISELSFAELAASPLSFAFLCSSISFGALAVISALKTSAQEIAETQRRTYMHVAASHVCYGLANFSSSAILMGIAFMSWAVASYRLAETVSATSNAEHS